MSFTDTLKGAAYDLVGLLFIAGGGFALIIEHSPAWAFGFGVFGALLISPARIKDVLAAAKPYLPGFLGGGTPPTPPAA